MEAAMVLIETRRPVVDFADVYVESVRRFLESRVESEPRSFRSDHLRFSCEFRASRLRTLSVKN
jgi:hypothetical protein